jgi:hypothetical protein
MPLPLPIRTRGKNLDCLIKMHGLADSTSDEKPIALRKSKRKKKNKTKTESATINNLPPSKDLAGMPNALTINQSVSKNWSIDNLGSSADLSATTHGNILNINGIATALSTTVASTANSLGVSATVTTATANTTIPSETASVK